MCTTTVWSRVTGFWRPVQNYNPGKVAEFKDRKHFKPEDGKNLPNKREQTRLQQS